MNRRHFLLLFSLFFIGCITPKAHENPKTTEELRHILQDFHMKLRWGLRDQAAAYTTADYRNEFLGRYEELDELCERSQAQATDGAQALHLSRLFLLDALETNGVTRDTTGDGRH